MNKLKETEPKSKMGDTYFIYNPKNVNITHHEEGKTDMKEKPIRSSWANGSFYLMTMISLALVYGYIAKDLPFYSLIIVVIGGILMTLVVGILQLRQDHNLKQKSFIELTKLIVNQLPLFSRILEIWKQSKTK